MDSNENENCAKTEVEAGESAGIKSNEASLCQRMKWNPSASQSNETKQQKNRTQRSRTSTILSFEFAWNNKLKESERGTERETKTTIEYEVRD